NESHDATSHQLADAATGPHQPAGWGHMGVNRGPSMAFRLLLEQGWDPIAALEAIREARPIANVAYAESAMRHFHRRNPGSAAERLDDLRRVRQWRHDWPLDVRTIVREIGRATR
ncbi:MAG: hypothetical protein ACKO1Y_08215, partial [Actinomycetota bacterium]